MTPKPFIPKDARGYFVIDRTLMCVQDTIDGGDFYPV